MGLCGLRCADLFCFLPGFPGRYSRTQVALMSGYLLLVLNGFVMFQLSLMQSHAIYAVSVKYWLALSVTGLTLAIGLGSSYYWMMAGTSGESGYRLFSLAIDFPRFWLACVASVLYNYLTVQVLFVFLYTRDHPEYAARLDEGLSTRGYLGFTETRVLDFLKQCQYNFSLHVLFLVVEYILYAKKEHFQSWMKSQKEMTTALQPRPRNS